VPVLAAVSAYRRKKMTTAKGRLETRADTFHTKHRRAISLGGSILLYRPGIRVTAFNDGVSVGNNIINYFFRRRKAASQ
jgi:hypothetical protein